MKRQTKMKNYLFPQLVVRKRKGKAKKGKTPSIFQLMNQVSKGTNALIRGVSDFDGDGVPNWKDCQPLNPRKQHNEGKVITLKDIERIDKSLLRGREPSDLSYSEYAFLTKERARRTPFIKVVRGYGIVALRDRGEILYHAIDTKTGLSVFSNRESLEEAIEDIKKGVPEQLSKQYPYLNNVRATYERMKRQPKLEEKYGSRAKRFKKYAGQKVLDIGAGIGPDFRATHAIDLRNPGETFQNLDYKWGYDFNKESTNLPYGNNSFDVVVSYGALGMNFESAKIYKEIYRVLKPGGRLELNHTSGNTVLLLRKAGFEKLHKESYFDESLDKRIGVLVTRKV